MQLSHRGLQIDKYAFRFNMVNQVVTHRSAFVT